MSTVLSGAPPETCAYATEFEAKPQFPGIPTTSDGAGMVVWVETHITQGACAYPITSSTTMGGGYQIEVANGTRKWTEMIEAPREKPRPLTTHAPVCRLQTIYAAQRRRHTDRSAGVGAESQWYEAGRHGGCRSSR